MRSASSAAALASAAAWISSSSRSSSLLVPNSKCEGLKEPPLAVSLAATAAAVSSSAPLISMSVQPSKKACSGARAFWPAILALSEAPVPFQTKKMNLAWRMADAPAPLQA